MAASKILTGFTFGVSGSSTPIKQMKAKLLALGCTLAKSLKPTLLVLVTDSLESGKAKDAMRMRELLSNAFLVVMIWRTAGVPIIDAASAYADDCAAANSVLPLSDYALDVSESSGNAAAASHGEDADVSMKHAKSVVEEKRGSSRKRKLEGDDENPQKLQRPRTQLPDSVAAQFEAAKQAVRRAAQAGSLVIGGVEMASLAQRERRQQSPSKRVHPAVAFSTPRNLSANSSSSSSAISQSSDAKDHSAATMSAPAPRRIPDNANRPPASRQLQFASPAAAQPAAPITPLRLQQQTSSVGSPKTVDQFIDALDAAQALPTAAERSERLSALCGKLLLMLQRTDSALERAERAAAKLDSRAVLEHCAGNIRVAHQAKDAMKQCPIAAPMLAGDAATNASFWLSHAIRCKLAAISSLFGTSASKPTQQLAQSSLDAFRKLSGAIHSHTQDVYGRVLIDKTLGKDEREVLMQLCILEEWEFAVV